MVADSLQVLRSGRKLYYVPEFVAYHVGDGSHWNYDPRFVYIGYRNKLIFQEKYLPKGLFPIWKVLLSMYARYRAKHAWRALAEKLETDKDTNAPFEDMEFALKEAIRDHGKDVLSEESLSHFAEALKRQKSVSLSS